MSYNPNLPQAGTEIDADQMRSQLNGLNDLIQAVPVLDSAAVDATTTLPPGTPAEAGVSITGNTLHFTFEIPQGETGQDGEVTESEMNSAIIVAVDGAIAGTSSNSNVVATLGMVVSDPPTQSEMQTLANKMDELILALRR